MQTINRLRLKIPPHVSVILNVYSLSPLTSQSATMVAPNNSSKMSSDMKEVPDLKGTDGAYSSRDVITVGDVQLIAATERCE